jgi:hypothetical protein
MAIFNSYVSLPEGKAPGKTIIAEHRFHAQIKPLQMTHG